MKVVITGGAGFIGSNLVHYWTERYPEDEVIVIDKFTYAANKRNLEGVVDRIKLYKIDIADIRALYEVFKKERPDTLLHLAAESHVDRSIREPAVFVRTNVVGTHNLLELSRMHDVDKFLYVSTDEVYGPIIEGYAKENDPFRPSSPYSASKASGDMFVNAYHVTYGMYTLVVRPTNNFGPRQHPEKLIPKTINNALKGRKIPLYGDGRYVRTWTYVKDTVRGIDIVLHKGEAGEAYNLSSMEERTNIEVVRKILQILGKPPDLITFVEDRPGHDRRYAVDTTKIRKLGWFPRWSFEEALKETVNWYLRNKWIFRGGR